MMLKEFYDAAKVEGSESSWKSISISIKIGIISKANISNPITQMVNSIKMIDTMSHVGNLVFSKYLKKVVRRSVVIIIMSIAMITGTFPPLPAKIALYSTKIVIETVIKKVARNAISKFFSSLFLALLLTKPFIPDHTHPHLYAIIYS